MCSQRSQRPYRPSAPDAPAAPRPLGHCFSCHLRLRDAATKAERQPQQGLGDGTGAAGQGRGLVVDWHVQGHDGGGQMSGLSRTPPEPRNHSRAEGSSDSEQRQVVGRPGLAGGGLAPLGTRSQHFPLVPRKGFLRQAIQPSLLAAPLSFPVKFLRR